MTPPAAEPYHIRYQDEGKAANDQNDEVARLYDVIEERDAEVTRLQEHLAAEKERCRQLEEKLKVGCACMSLWLAHFKLLCGT